MTSWQARLNATVVHEGPCYRLASATVAALFPPVLLWLAVATYYLYVMLRFESAGG